jgi:hypothetical protein
MVVEQLVCTAGLDIALEPNTSHMADIMGQVHEIQASIRSGGHLGMAIERLNRREC